MNRYVVEPTYVRTSELADGGFRAVGRGGRRQSRCVQNSPPPIVERLLNVSGVQCVSVCLSVCACACVRVVCAYVWLLR